MEISESAGQDHAHADGAAVMEHVLKGKAGKSASGRSPKSCSTRERAELRRTGCARGAELHFVFRGADDGRRQCGLARLLVRFLGSPRARRCS